MPSLFPVGRHELALGRPLPYSVYDRNGVLLLKAGFTVNLERHLERLIENGLFAREDEEARRAAATQTALESSDPILLRPEAKANEEPPRSFEALDIVKLRLQRLFEQLRQGRPQESFVHLVSDLALEVQEACTHDTDAALANLHLDYETSYAVVHHLQAAILCELIGKKLGVGDDPRLVLVCAALTHDLDLLDIQDQLDRQVEALTPAQKTRIHAHPGDGARRLHELGVDDRVWLEVVRNHHERLDGSGYAAGLSGDAIGIPTRILAVADTYSAMIRDRPYRKAMVTREAMRNLLVDQGRQIDQRLIQLMIKEVGVFPPGAIVRLSSGEIGVVKERQENATQPIVYSFVRADGMPMLTPARRETSRADHGVEGIVPFSKYRGCVTLIRGLWLNA